jgi:glycosyltransferase involved in cell wall biosynthesis
MAIIEPSSTPAAGDSAVAVVVPTYNVGDLVLGVARRVIAAGFRAIVVDDGSTDGGTRGLEGLPVTVVRLTPNRGKGHAILAGFAKALEDPAVEAVAVLDADGQHDPAELPRLCAAFRAHGADLLIGSRDFGHAGVPFRSRFGNVLTARLLGWLLGVRVPDTQSGYRILSRRFAEAVLREVPGGRYETEMAIVGLAIRGGYRIASESIRTIYEPGNRTSHFRKLSDSWRVYRTLFRWAIGRGERNRNKFKPD